MKLKKPDMKTILLSLAGMVLILASFKRIHLSLLLDLPGKVLRWKRVSHALCHVLVVYGISFLGLALLSYVSSLRGTDLASAVANRTRQALRELRQAVCSSVRDGFASSKDVAWLMAALAVGLVVRGYFLAHPMRYDESHTFLTFVNQTPFFLFYYSSPNNHVLHTLLVKLSTLIWGSHPVSIRLPAFLFGIASVPLTFCLCRKLMPERSGILASAAMAVAPYMVIYSANARGYSLLVFLTLALAFLGLHVVETPSLPGWALVSLIAALGMLTMPSMLFAIAGLYLWLGCLLFCRQRSFGAIMREFLIPCGIMTLAFTFLLYTPSIVASGGVGSMLANHYLRSSRWSHFFHRLIPHIQKFFDSYMWNPPCPALLLSIGAILLIAGMFRAAKSRDWPLLFLLPSMLLGAGAVFLLKHAIPPDRIWIYLMPFSFVLMDAGLTSLKEKFPRSLRLLLALLLIMVGLLSALSPMFKETKGSLPDAPLVVRYLKPLLSSNDIVHMGRPASWPIRFYIWYYGLPQAKNAASLEARREFFIVKKSLYTIESLTEKPVVKLLDTGDAAVYQLLPPEEIRGKRAINSPRGGTIPR
jgi:4-amino-4-deoxy-L-arabinose transferase-like glycosyltransferase